MACAERHRSRGVGEIEQNVTESSSLQGKRVLVTGGARRVGRMWSLAVASLGAEVLIHHGHSPEAAAETARLVEAAGGQARVLQADLSDPAQIERLMAQVLADGPLFALVNNAAIFEPLDWQTTDLPAWERHLRINLTAPFLLSQAFARALPPGAHGRIVNILDWRALRPGADHLPYTVSKAALAALTRSLALALAPRITVNGIALGAVLPPADGSGKGVLRHVPAGRQAAAEEVAATLRFLLTGPAYITGEIIHLDGGRHLV